MVKTTITVKDGVMTIHGMTSGDYVSHKMSITEPPVTPDGRVLYSEVELRYKDGNVQEDFTKKLVRELYEHTPRQLVEGYNGSQQ